MSEPPTPAPDDGTPTATHHWIMTIQSDRGRQATSDGGITPGTHSTSADIYSEVLNAMKAYVGSTNCTVIFYSLAPNAIDAPAVAR